MKNETKKILLDVIFNFVLWGIYSHIDYANLEAYAIASILFVFPFLYEAIWNISKSDDFINLTVHFIIVVGFVVIIFPQCAVLMKLIELNKVKTIGIGILSFQINTFETIIYSLLGIIETMTFFKLFTKEK